MLKNPNRHSISPSNHGGLLLYDRARNDMFQTFNDEQLKHVRSLFTQQQQQQQNERSVALRHPSITTMMLLQCQVSLIQVISSLPSKRKPTTDFVKLTVSSGQQVLRWSMLCGLFVLDNVSRALGVENEMVSLNDESAVFVDGHLGDDDHHHPHHHEQPQHRLQIEDRPSSATTPSSSTYHRASSSISIDDAPSPASPSPPPVPALTSSTTSVSHASSVCSSSASPAPPKHEQQESTSPPPAPIISATPAVTVPTTITVAQPPEPASEPAEVSTQTAVEVTPLQESASEPAEVATQTAVEVAPPPVTPPPEPAELSMQTAVEVASPQESALVPVTPTTPASPQESAPMPVPATAVVAMVTQPEPRQSNSTPLSSPPRRSSPTPSGTMSSRLPIPSRIRTTSLPLGPSALPRSRHTRSSSGNMPLPSYHALAHQQHSLRRSTGRRDLTNGFRAASTAPPSPTANIMMRPKSNSSADDIPQVHYHHHHHYHQDTSASSSSSAAPVVATRNRHSSSIKRILPWKS